MKILAITALLTCAACGPRVITVTPPVVPNAKLILALDTIRTSCLIAQPFIESVAVGNWVGVGCPAAVNTAVVTIQAAGVTGKMQGVLSGITTFLGTRPVGMSLQDAAYVNAAIVLANQFISDYKALYPNAT